ncbi:hypothetical protein AMATHDRAFT_59512 [Amanita thiersii Skay4041]|uniref:DUF6534 domain-containing protein n=1 Tax=Amanita thiersii Skay4041 TaxID=703135 RepID=A0A2A9NSI0_9AGAR|nr:hypothetical protein AMATHDRAFT_59512 [Amanita thiersii Skay4041]
MPITFHSTLGAMFVGFCVACVIFGVLSIQVFTYFRRFPSDRSVYKVLVAAIWLLEVLDQVLIGYSVYFYVISHYGDIITLVSKKIVWTLLVQTCIGSFVGLIVKSCFCTRVWRFSGRNVVITGTILFLVVATFVLAVVYTVRAFTLRAILQLELPHIKLIATIALASGVGTDVLTATALCYYLRKLRTGHRKSDSLVNTLTVYAINTGALTSAISLSTLLLYNLKPNTFYFMATYFALGKLYAISLLCTLNTRKIVRGRGTDRGGHTSTNPDVHFLVNHHTRSMLRSQPLQDKSTQIDVVQDISIAEDIKSSRGENSPNKRVYRYHYNYI